MPEITVLLPTFQADRYLKECVMSILNQDYSDFELLVIDDHSTDQTMGILQAFDDPRIRIVFGEGKGIAAALNKGLLEAAGKYIARIDADDLMTEDRLRIQRAYLESHPQTIVCGGWQKYFGRSKYYHKPSALASQCQSNLLFRCDLCHSTVMLRKAAFLDNGLFYDSYYAAEDYELWTRVLDYGNIENIPQILGYYRDDGHGLTNEKKELLIKQHGQIVANSLYRNLSISISDEQKKYFTGWIHPFHDSRSGINYDDRKASIEDLKRLFSDIIKRNREVGYYDDMSLMKTVAAEWRALRYCEPYYIDEDVIREQDLFVRQNCIEVQMKRFIYFLRKYPGIKNKFIALSGYFHN